MQLIKYFVNLKKIMFFYLLIIKWGVIKTLYIIFMICWELYRIHQHIKESVDTHTWLFSDLLFGPNKIDMISN